MDSKFEKNKANFYSNAIYSSGFNFYIKNGQEDGFLKVF